MLLPLARAAVKLGCVPSPRLAATSARLQPSRSSRGALGALPALSRPRSTSSRSLAVAAMSSTEPVHSFGPHTIRASEVFVSTDLCLGLVNLKPVVPGHVLIIPRRVAERFQDLTPQEVSDMWMLAQRVGTALEKHFNAASLTLAIQDGPAAGQTVPHVHVHVLPRRLGDFENNDEVYDAIDAASKDATKAMEVQGEKLDLDAERVVRTMDQMAEEAAELRALF